MTDDTAPTHRSRYRAGDGDVRLALVEDEDVMELEFPIASSGEVRNDGDEPLTTAELKGMARQIERRSIGVFLEHGESDLVDGAFGYSQAGKLGVWTAAEFRSEAAADDSDLLVATARMPDPEELPSQTGPYRTALAIIKEQARVGVPMDASIGWRDDESFPGGVDLMEASIVGIGADPRTSTAAANPVATVTRAAVDAGADPADLVAQVREAVDDERPLGPPEDPDRFEDFDECVDALAEDPDLSREDAENICGAWEQNRDRATYEVEGETIDITPPESMVNAAREALDAKSRFDELDDCGTGVGEDRANQIIADEVGPDVIDEIAAYLTSHAEDVEDYDAPPTDWDREEWLGIIVGEDDDPRCGPVQYALWGGTTTGTSLDWSQRKANEVAEARGEDIPYPDRSIDQDMSQADDPPDDGGSDSESTDTQATDDDGASRAPEDVSDEDIADFMASHFDGMDVADVMDAVEASGGEYVGAVDKRELAALVAICVDVSTGQALEAMEELQEMDNEDEQATDDDEMEDEDDEDEDDDDRYAADDEADETQALREEVREMKQEFEETKEKLRAGGFEAADPGDVADELADEDEDSDGEQRDSEGSDGSATPADPAEEWLSEVN
jgi:hypothetical protein